MADIENDVGGTLTPAPTAQQVRQPQTTCQPPLFNRCAWGPRGEAHGFGQVLCHGTALARGAVLGWKYPLKVQQHVQIALRHHLLLRLLQERVTHRKDAPAPQSNAARRATPVLLLQHCSTRRLVLHWWTMYYECFRKWIYNIVMMTTMMIVVYGDWYSVLQAWFSRSIGPESRYGESARPPGHRDSLAWQLEDPHNALSKGTLVHADSGRTLGDVSVSIGTVDNGHPASDVRHVLSCNDVCITECQEDVEGLQRRLWPHTRDDPLCINAELPGGKTQS